MDLDRLSGVIVNAVKLATVPLIARIKALEARKSLDGKDGAKGEPGERGEKGELGERGESGLQGIAGERGERGLVGETGAPGPPGELPIDVLERIAALETKSLMPPPVDEITAEACAESLLALFTKEVAAVELPLRMQKRVIRDANGKVERVVDEPAA